MLFQCSVAESQCSTSEGQTSVGESLRSDLSWVAVEDVYTDCQRTLWVPDHAVNKCTGCSTEFWLGRRRHHCRYAIFYCIIILMIKTFIVIFIYFIKIGREVCHQDHHYYYGIILKI